MVASTAGSGTGPLYLFQTPMQSSTTSLSCTDVIRTGVIPGTGPLAALAGGPWSYGDYLRRIGQRMRTDPALTTGRARVLDVQALYDRDRSLTTAWHTDPVHLAIPGALWAGQLGRDELDTWNTCTVQRPQRRVPQRYCRQPDGAWRSPAVACTTSAACTVGDRCARRPCTVNDDTASGCPLTSPADFCHLVGAG
jgi:hypothetical protein